MIEAILVVLVVSQVLTTVLLLRLSNKVNSSLVENAKREEEPVLKNDDVIIPKMPPFFGIQSRNESLKEIDDEFDKISEKLEENISPEERSKLFTRENELIKKLVDKIAGNSITATTDSTAPSSNG